MCYIYCCFPVLRQAILQKGNVLDQSGNYEMALVYYNRGAKHFPRAQEFKEGIKKAEKQSVRTGEDNDSNESMMK